jgi:hypothetical protein
MLERLSPQARRREWHRAYRQRQAVGHLGVRFVVTPEDTAKLHRLGHLRDSELEDRRAIARAIRSLLASIILDGG